MMPRSYLFVPGDRLERCEKALASGADAVIVDLEDAVAPAKKDVAREALAAWLRPEHKVVVRINAAGTPWFDADLALAARPGVAALMLPKAESAQAVVRLVAAGARSVLPLIETAAGFEGLRTIASAPGVVRLVFGSIDFQLDLGMAHDGDDDADALLFFRSQLVLVSRLAGLVPPVDGVSVAIDDAARIEADTRRARRLGFGAKLCIHPRQIEPVHAGFAPSLDEIDWARRVVAANERSGGAAVAVDGRMVDAPVLRRAQRLLDAARDRPAGSH